MATSPITTSTARAHCAGWGARWRRWRTTTARWSFPPPFEEAHFNRGATRLDLGDLDGAVADFERVIELNPANLDARLNLASVLVDQGDADRARAEVRVALVADPTHPHLLCLSGRLLSEAGDPVAAEAALVEALRHDPTLAEAWALRGELAFAGGDLAAARVHLDRAAELDPSAPVLYNRAVVAEAQGRYADAVADLDRFLALADDDEARQRRAACLDAGSLTDDRRPLAVGQS